MGTPPRPLPDNGRGGATTLSGLAYLGQEASMSLRAVSRLIASVT